MEPLSSRTSSDYIFGESSARKKVANNKPTDVQFVCRHLVGDKRAPQRYLVKDLNTSDNEDEPNLVKALKSKDSRA